MNFAVAFLKMLTLYVLWSAQFLTELHAVFCIDLIWILLPLCTKFWDQKVTKKKQNNVYYLWL